MKLTCSRDDLHSALAFCRTAIKSGGAPILSNVILRGSSGGLFIAAHNQYSSKHSIVPAKIFEPGETTLPAEELYQILSGIPKSQPVNIVVKDHATISWGKARYNLGILPASDFPALLDLPEANAISLNDGLRADLFERPTGLIMADATQPKFCGIYLHSIDGWLHSLGSDGTRMLRTSAQSKVAGLQPISVPRDMAQEIVRMRADRVWWSNRYIAASSGNNVLTASLLADATFGDDYESYIPSAEGPHLLFNRKELLAAFQRLSAIAIKGSIVRVHWLAEPKTATLEFVNQSATEVIECAGKSLPTGKFGVPPIRFAELLALLKGERVRLFQSASMAPLRLVSDEEPSMIAMQAPCLA